MSNKHPVSQKRLQRFAKINEDMFERTVNAESQAFAQYKELSYLQIQVIRLIEYHKPCTMTHIANSTGLSLASITQLIDRLIRKGYVERERNQTDRRVVIAKLTQKGQEVIEASRSHVNLVGQNILAKFNSKEQEALLNVFERMVNE